MWEAGWSFLTRLIYPENTQGIESRGSAYNNKECFSNHENQEKYDRVERPVGHDVGNEVKVATPRE